MLVPRLEREHARGERERRATSPTTPSIRRRPIPRNRSASCSTEMGVARARSGADQDGYPWILGYRGPSADRARRRYAGEDHRLRRGPDGGQEPGRDRADPRELRSGANLAHVLLAALHAAGADRERGRRVRATHTRPRWRCSTRIGPIYRRPELRSSTARAPATAARSAATRAIPHALANNIVVPGRRRARHRSDGARLGLPLRARADDGDRASRQPSSAGCSTTWSRCRTSPSRRSSRARGAPDVDRAVRAYYERARASCGLLEPPRRPRDRPPLPRRAVPRHRRRHARSEPGMVFTRRAGPLRGRPRWLPPLGHRRRHRRRDRVPHRTTHATSRALSSCPRLALERKEPAEAGPSREIIRRRPTLPGGCPPSTIGAGGLNFSVRNGKRCFPAAMTAEIVKGAARSPRTLKTP